MTLDLCIQLALLFFVVAMPWIIVMLGLRRAMHSMDFLDEVGPVEQAALIARYQNLD
jgi:hypothetical protein